VGSIDRRSRAIRPDGSLASYSWSFGDSITATTSAPTITHIDAKPGSYTATLTVTDNEGCSTAVIFTGHTAHRDRLRAQGLRPAQIWVPDSGGTLRPAIRSERVVPGEVGSA
jgi:hypothetical protein